MLSLQRSIGNSAVGRLIGSQRRLARRQGWSGVPPKSVNAGPDTLPGIKRIPIEGISGAYEKGRAIVLIPADLSDSVTKVDVLVHFHGFNTGNAGNSAKSVRDIAHDKVEAQLAEALRAGTRPTIAILPQGSGHSVFGSGTSSVSASPYLNSVFQILSDIKAWGDRAPPARGGLILSGHSGADVAVEQMLTAARGGHSGEVANLEALFVFDNMYTDNDAKKVIAFLQFRLARDLVSLGALRDKATGDEGAIRQQLAAWITLHGFRFRGIESTGSFYHSRFEMVKAALRTFLDDPKTIAVIGESGPARKAMDDNLQIVPAGVSHDDVIGANHNLAGALGSLAKGAGGGPIPLPDAGPTGQTTTTPAQVTPPTRQQKPPAPPTPVRQPPPPVQQAPPPPTHVAPPTPATKTTTPATSQATTPAATTSTWPTGPITHAQETGTAAAVVGRVETVASPLIGTASGGPVWSLIRDQFASPRTKARTKVAATDPLAPLLTELYSKATVTELSAMNAGARSTALSMLFNRLVPATASPSAGATAPTMDEEIADEQKLISKPLRAGADGGWKAVRQGVLAAFGVFQFGTRGAIEQANAYYKQLKPARLFGITAGDGALVHPVMQARLDDATAALSGVTGAEKTQIEHAVRDMGGFDIRPNANNHWVLSLHSFGWAIDLAAATNPNFGEKNKLMGLITSVTGSDPEAQHANQHTMADAQASATAIQQISQAFTTALSDEAHLTSTILAIANRSRHDAGLDPLSGDGSDVRAAAGGGGAAAVTPVMAIVGVGATPKTAPALRRASQQIVAAVHGFKASFKPSGARKGGSTSAAEGSIASVGFMNLPPRLVGALIGTDAGKLQWLGTSSVHDYMHFELTPAQRPNLIGAAAGPSTPATTATASAQGGANGGPPAVTGTDTGPHTGPSRSKLPKRSPPPPPPRTQTTPTTSTGTAGKTDPDAKPSGQMPAATNEGSAGVTTYAQAPAPGTGVTLTEKEMKRLHARDAHVIEFYRHHIGPALEVQRAEGIPALFTLAQMANETGYGVSRPGFNLFGVKASTKLPESARQLLWTTEYDQSPNARYPEIAPDYPILVPDPHHKGKTIWKYKVKDWFRVYASEAESMRDHTQVLHQRNYAEAWTHTEDPEAFTRAVAKGGYATAPNYASALIAGIHLLNRIAALVNQEDAGAATGAASTPALTGAH